MSLHVHWYEGLFLQPHHLQIMQRGLREQIQSERRLAIPYPYGLIEAEVSPDELANGSVVFRTLRAVMRSGLEVRLPGNAVVPTLEIGPALAQAGGALTLYLGVPKYFANRANAFAAGETVDPRVKLLYRLEETEFVDENNGKNPHPVQQRLINARLLLETEAQQAQSLPPDRSDLEVLPLLRIKRATNVAGDLPRLDPEFVPPCLLLSGSAALYKLVTDLVATLESRRSELELQITRGGMGLEARLETMLRLRTLNRYCAGLPSLLAAPAVTPLEVFLRLRELQGELAALKPGQKMFAGVPYNHDRPYGCFEELNSRIRELTRLVGVEPMKVAFEVEADRPTARLKEEHFTKPNGWYLGIRTKLERTTLVLYVKDGNRFKLMPQSRVLSAFYGVELREENFPPHELPAQADLHYFRIIAGETSMRWQEIKEEKTAVLVWNNSEFDLSDATFTLYMTLPTSS